MSLYHELRQDAARKWQDNLRVRQSRYETVKMLMKKPWRCPACGAGGLLDPICPHCRSARIIELD